MAYINIIGRKDPVKVNNQDARIIKKIWLGDEKTPPADKDRPLDLGDVWAGKYGQIRNVELEPEYKPKPEDKPEPELTEEQKAINRERFKRMRKDMEKIGLLKPK